MSTSILDLPLDVIQLILILLPVKTLLRLKIVNKLCQQFISSSDFVRNQLKHSSILSNSGIIVTSPGSIDRISIHQFMHQTPSTDDVLHQNSFDRIPMILSPVSLCNSSNNVVVVGSCNGLICIFKKEYNEFRLWNPCIKKSKLLCFLESGSASEVIGFGYDERNKDYKVVASDAHVSKPKVFSVKRNSWKSISGLAGWVLDGDTSQFASGKIHWLANVSSSNSSGNKKIISFNLRDEEFDLVEPPRNYPDVRSLGALDGRLCVLCCGHQDNSARDLWIMEGRRWTKLVSIPGTILREMIVVDFWSSDREELRACYMLPNGEIVFDNGKCFWVYNSEHADIRRIQFHGKIRPVIHVQTLVSPRALL